MSSQRQAPVVITSARAGRSDDISRRQVKYLVSMGVRTACFLLAVVTSGPLRWGLVAAAFVLPYFAVVLANAADDRGSPGPASFEAEGRPEITAGSTALPPGTATGSQGDTP